MDDDLKLLDVAIHRFRGFAWQDRPPLHFGDVTVLVGANGHGKTTVFDAIDWALFGDEWRWAQADSDVTRGLRRPDEVPAVTLRLKSEAEHSLVRNGPKVTWDGLSFDQGMLCRNQSVFARSAELVRALRGVTYLPQEDLRVLVTSGAKGDRHALLATLAGVPFADRFDRNLKNTRGDLELRERAADRDLSQIAIRRTDLLGQLEGLRGAVGWNADVLAQLSAFVGHSGINPLTAEEEVTRRLLELKHAEQSASARARDSVRLARELEETVAAEGETRAALGRTSRELEDANRLLAAASEAERRLLEEQAQGLSLLQKFGTLAGESRAAYRDAQQLYEYGRSILSASGAVDASKVRLEILEKQVIGCQQAMTEAVAASAAATERVEMARRRVARATERNALLAQQSALELRLSTLGQQVVEGEASHALSVRHASEAKERESLSQARIGELHARLRRSLEGAERVAQIIGELLGIQGVDDPKCLICGHDHRDGWARADAMRGQLKQAAEMTEVAKELAAAEAKLAVEANQAEIAKRRERDSVARLSTITEERAQLKSQVETLNVRLADPQGQDWAPLEGLAAHLRECTTAADAAAETLAMAQQSLTAAQVDLTTGTETVRQLARVLEGLRANEQNRAPVDDARLTALQQAAERAAGEMQAAQGTAEANATLQKGRALEVMRARSLVESLDSSVQAETAKLEQLGKRRALCIQEAEALGVKGGPDTFGPMAELRDAAVRFDEEARRSREMAASGQALQGPAAMLKASSRIQEIERELTEINAKQRDVVARTQRVRAAQGRLDEIATAVGQAMAASATGAIKGAEERINEVLSELCPHQHLNVLRLAQDGVLLATDEAGSPRVKPEYYGSTGQLGCMGLAVFLGIALGQRWSRLKVLLLDEPVQNMDDVNFVRFLDLIRRLAETHQIVVSTADKNIGELLRRKLMLWADGQTKTAVIHRFDAFDVEKGPTVVTEELNRLRAVGG